MTHRLALQKIRKIPIIYIISFILFGIIWKSVHHPTKKIIKKKNDNEEEKISTNESDTKSLNGNGENLKINLSIKYTEKTIIPLNENDNSESSLSLEKMQKILNSFTETYEKKINDLQSENNNMNKKINDLLSENIKMNNNISKLSIEVEDLKNELNTIKIRDKIKNILKSFSFILTAAEEKELEQKIKKPIEIYPKAFEKHYEKYNELKKFLFLKILLTKSCELLEEGN